jgi:glycosyltransferase involved in cell wall biosynthesis
MAHVQTTVAMYAAMHLEVSFSFTGHAVDLFAQRTMLYQKLRRALFIVCISRWHRAFYQRIVGRRGRDLPIVRCGVDVNEFRPPADTVVAARSGPVRIVSVGRLVPKKGLDLLIEAISQLVREGLEVECRIIGDGPEMPRLRRMRIEQGVAQHLELPGALNNGDIGRELAAADLFVLPCRVAARGDRDGIPVALMEAMACGVCVVSGDIVTIRELIEHDRNGVMVRPGSSTALADALRALVHDPQRRRELGAAGRKTVEDEFALDLNLDRMAELFRRSVCGAAEPPQPGARTGPEHVAAPQVRAA